MQTDLFALSPGESENESKTHLTPSCINYVRNVVQGVFDQSPARILTLCEVDHNRWKSTHCSCKDWNENRNCEHIQSMQAYCLEYFKVRAPAESFNKSAWFVLFQKWHVSFGKLLVKVRLPTVLQFHSLDHQFSITLKSPRLAEILTESFWGLFKHFSEDEIRKLRLEKMPQALDFDQMFVRTLGSDELSGYTSPQVNSSVEMEQSLLYSFLKHLMYYLPEEERHKLSRSGEYQSLTWTIEGGLGSAI
jgi:hypothetical protein